MVFFCDDKRHLVCLPYSVDNLHKMATELGIKTCWFHNKPGLWHYDIPKRRVAEITAKCTLVTSKQIITIINTGEHCKIMSSINPNTEI